MAPGWPALFPSPAGHWFVMLLMTQSLAEVLIMFGYSPFILALNGVVL